jgi:two-component system LytT family sensor kinase
VILGYKNTRQILITYSIVLSITVAGLLVRLSKWREFSVGLQVKTTIASIVLVVVMWESLRLVHRLLNKVYPFEVNLVKRMLIQISCGVGIGLTVRFIVYFFGEPALPFKLDSLFLAATWAIYMIVPTAINLGFISNYFIDRWKDSLVLAERLEKEKSQVQFDNLKNQLNPHFLFNALTSLNSLIFEDQKLASQFLQQLSKIYRYVLLNKDKNFVTLQTVLDFIQHYISLLDTRFKDAIHFKIDIRDDARSQAIVPVTLQILIENALKHNVVDKTKPLTIEITSIGDYLVVSNNLQLRKRVETSNKLGLENLRSLYSFFSDKPVLIEPTTDRFYVKVPLI